MNLIFIPDFVNPTLGGELGDTIYDQDPNFSRDSDLTSSNVR